MKKSAKFVVFSALDWQSSLVFSLVFYIQGLASKAMKSKKRTKQ